MPRPKVAQPRRPASTDALLLWVIHRFADAFEHHAILKGGMALRLLDSPRHTNDVDFVFVPYGSKSDVTAQIERVLGELEEADVKTLVHSKMIRSEIRLDQAAVQVEINVSEHCASIPMATAALAGSVGVPSQVVRVMAPDVALAHKLAAWNERRLLRDLYDAYFLAARAGASPDREVLHQRLSNVQSRLPALRRRKRVSLGEFLAELDAAVAQLSADSLDAELSGLLDNTERAGLDLRIRTAIKRVIEDLRA